MKRQAFLLVFLLGASVTAKAYETKPPDWVSATLRWRDAAGAQREITGQLEFLGLPAQRLHRGGFGIQNLVPLREGDVSIRRGEGAHEGKPLFLLKDYRGEHPFVWTVDTLPVLLRDLGMKKVEVGQGYVPPPVEMDLDEDPPGTEASADTPRDSRALALYLDVDPPVAKIPVEALQEIVFSTLAQGGYKREAYRGRYVEYSRAAKGDHGTIRPLAATFFGGEGEEQFSHGGFFSDGRIFAAGTFHQLEHVPAKSVRVLGADTDFARLAPKITRDAQGRERRLTPASTPVLVLYGPDLKQVREIVRLPWGTGGMSRLLKGNEDELYLAGRAGESFETVFAGLRVKSTVDYPERVEAVEKAAAARKTAPRYPEDFFLLRLSPDLRSVDWGIRFKHSGVDVAVLPDGRLIVKRDQNLFYVDARSGKVAQGPPIEMRGSASGMVVDPRDGSLYFGGEYHSGTGLEPWRCPFARKFSPDGKLIWSAYDWTGPIVGVEFFRLVSDSAIHGIHANRNGELLLTGWSDGGNSVFTRQPYDLRKAVSGEGFASSIWGANVLSVPYLIQMNADSMEVSGITRFLSYRPLADLPNSIKLQDAHLLESGSVAITGGSAFGLIETHDAWVTPWFVEYQTNRHAVGRGGGFLTVYDRGLQRLRLSTIVPGMHRAGLASQGNKLLLFGSATSEHIAYNDGSPAIVLDAVQALHGGGRLDAYLMLIDTAAPPIPTILPEKTW